MSHVGIDMFEFGGSQHMVCIDQWSGYPMYQNMNSATPSAVIKVLIGWFKTLGLANVIRSNGGPQFCSEFVQFCDENGIKHELSSPYNPRANGLAESGVKIVKNLLLKCMNERGDMQRVIHEWSLPQPHTAFTHIDFNKAANAVL